MLLLGAALVGIYVNQIAFVYAIDLTTASTVALIFGTLPVLTALFAYAFGIERLSRRFWIAAVFSFAGVALVAVGSEGGVSGDVTGDLLALVGAASWGLYSIAIAPLMRSYSPFRISAIALLAGCVPLAADGAASAHRPGLGSARARLGGVRVRGAGAARPHERPLVHRDRPRRPLARHAGHEPAAVSRGRLRRGAALGDDHARCSSSAVRRSR